MHIGGFQKMTMLDYPGKVACTVFTHACNLRCPFCHNAPLVVGEYTPVSEEEILTYLKKRKGILDGVCITGGEPLLQKDIRSFIERVRALGLSVKLDTNGTFPEKLRELIDAGLVDYVAMDVKNSPARYAETTGLSTLDLAPIEESIRILKENRVPYEFRTTVVRELHSEADMQAIGAWLAGAERYFLQQFTDSGALLGEGYSAHDEGTLKTFADIVRPYIPAVATRGI